MKKRLYSKQQNSFSFFYPHNNQQDHHNHINDVPDCAPKGYLDEGLEQQGKGSNGDGQCHLTLCVKSIRYHSKCHHRHETDKHIVAVRHGKEAVDIFLSLNPLHN